MTYHSEYGQDRWLEEHVFRGQRGGVVVEAGAMDGVMHSNSLFFERDMGWSAVLVEPNPAAYRTLLKNRKEASVFCCALGDVEGDAEFLAVSGDLYGWSAVIDTLDNNARNRLDCLEAAMKRPIRVEVHRLARLLMASGVKSVDYLSLDVEGGEYAVLKNYPFDDIPIRVIGVEDNDDNNTDLRHLLRSQGYCRLARIGVDNIWIK